jgi:putative membrane protein
MEQLHPGAKWLFRIRVYGGFIPLLIFAFIFSIALSTTKVYFQWVFLLIFIIFVMIISEVYARMAYNRWFYEFTKDNLKIERGVIWKRYSNVPYERVQNVDITRGIIARILGFSSVNIQTAGYSGFSGGGWQFKVGGRRYNSAMNAEGYLPAVNMEAAEKIREFLIKKISRNN